MIQRNDYRDVSKSKDLFVIGLNLPLDRKVVAQVISRIFKTTDSKERISLCKEENFDELCKEENLKVVREFYYSPLTGITDTIPVFKEKCTNPVYYKIVELYDRHTKVFILVY